MDIVARFRHVAGGVALVAGGGAWIWGLVALSIEHPGLDSRLFLWPLAGIVATGLGVAVAYDWRRWRSDPLLWGTFLVSAGVTTIVPFAGVVGIALWLIGALLLGFQLQRHGPHRVAGALLFLGGVMFLITRPWQLGPALVGDALALQELVERLLAALFGSGWVLLGCDEVLTGLGISGTAAPRT